MDQEDIKNYLLATMGQFQSHQAEIARMSISLEAVTLALKERIPGFAAEYAVRLESLKQGPTIAESQRLIERLEVAIRGLLEGGKA